MINSFSRSCSVIVRGNPLRKDGNHTYTFVSFHQTDVTDIRDGTISEEERTTARPITKH